MASSMGVADDDMVDNCLTGAKPKAYLRNMSGGCRRMRPAVLIGSSGLSTRKPDAVT